MFMAINILGNSSIMCAGGSEFLVVTVSNDSFFFLRGLYFYVGFDYWVQRRLNFIKPLLTQL